MERDINCDHNEKDKDHLLQEQHYFEGVEKLLEVWFTRKDGALHHCDLRKVPRLVFFLSFCYFHFQNNHGRVMCALQQQQEHTGREKGYE